MDANEVRTALLVMFRKQIANWTLLSGVAYGLSREGMTRLDIMRFYWDLMVLAPSPFSQSQLDLIGDFCGHLLGQCSLDQIIRLYGDPWDPEELGRRVAEDASKLVPPS